MPIGSVVTLSSLVLPKDKEQTGGRSRLQTPCLNWELLEPTTSQPVLNIFLHYSHHKGVVSGKSDKAISAQLRQRTPSFPFLFLPHLVIYWSDK